MDDEFTDAEIRTLLRKAASDRQRYEISRRLEHTKDLRDQSGNAENSERVHETPLRALAPAR